MDLLTLAVSPDPINSNAWHQSASTKRWYKYTNGKRGYKDLEYVGDRILYMMVIHQQLDNPLADPTKRHEFVRELVKNKTLHDLSIALDICPPYALNEPDDRAKHTVCGNFIESIIGALYVQYNDIQTLTDWFFNLDPVYELYQKEQTWNILGLLYEQELALDNPLRIPKVLDGKWDQTIEYINTHHKPLSIELYSELDNALFDEPVNHLVLKHKGKVYYEVLFITDYREDFHGKELVEELLYNNIIEYRNVYS